MIRKRDTCKQQSESKTGRIKVATFDHGVYVESMLLQTNKRNPHDENYVLMSSFQINNQFESGSCSKQEEMLVALLLMSKHRQANDQQMRNTKLVVYQ